MFAVGCIINVKRIDQGPQFTSGVSPSKITNMLGKQITAGQLTNREVHNNARTSYDGYNEIYLGITT